MNSVSKLLIVCLACITGYRLGAAELTGTVRSSAGESAEIVLSSDMVPAVGDKVEIFFTIPGGDTEIAVGTAKVTSIGPDSVQVKVEQATGVVAKDQLVRIHSANPTKRTAAMPATPSVPAPSSEAPRTPPPAAAAGLLQKATKDAPFVNSLGMKFVPVPIVGGPTDTTKSGRQVLFCIHETRKGDYRRYAATVRDVNGAWDDPSFYWVPVSTTDAHPVVNVNWEDAVAFCEWLSKTEGREYRLPTDHEWSCAVGIGAQEDPELNPEEKSGRIANAYPWGNAWPPPDKAGNYGDATSQKVLKFTDIDPYDDGHAVAAPVMSFTPNSLGLYDLGGNVWEWCQDWYGTGKISKVLRGESWWSSGGTPDSKLSSYRFSAWANSYHARAPNRGFRCVLVTGSAP